MRVQINMVYPARIKSTGPAYDAMNFIPFRKQELGQIGPILPGYSGNKRFLHML